MTARLFLAVLLACMLQSACLPARAGLVINEFLADPEGADGGREFVEILNGGSGVEELLGVCLEFGNGAVAGDWTMRWCCQEPWTLAGGQRLLLVDRNWLDEDNPGQVEVYLGLQNGPDAIRLVRAGQVLDMVGYGALTDTLMMETAPAALETGLSLARRPDGRDTQDNSLDFVAAEPTPGRANFRAHELTLLAVIQDPPALDRPGREVVSVVHLRNTGTEELAPGPLQLVGIQEPVSALLDLAAPDAQGWLEFHWRPAGEGVLPLALSFPLAGTQDTLLVPLGDFQVGPGSLVLNEVMSAPDAGQGEWVEVVCGGEQAVQTGQYRLRDEDGDWVDLPDLVLLPGEYLVLAQDPTGLLDWQEANRQAGALGPCAEQDLSLSLATLAGGWPTLNNAPPEGREHADRVVLARGDLVVDQVVLGGAEAENLDPGARSWERLALRPANPLAANWSAATARAGSTPGCSNSLSGGAAASGELRVEPAVFGGSAGPQVQHLRFRVPAGAAGWSLSIHDTWGRQVRDLGGDLAGPGPRDLIWDGRDETGEPVPAGAYVVLLVFPGQGLEVATRRQALSAVYRDSP